MDVTDSTGWRWRWVDILGIVLTLGILAAGMLLVRERQWVIHRGQAGLHILLNGDVTLDRVDITIVTTDGQRYGSHLDRVVGYAPYRLAYAEMLDPARTRHFDPFVEQIAYVQTAVPSSRGNSIFAQRVEVR